MPNLEKLDLGAVLRLRFVAEHDWVSGAIRFFEGQGVGPSHVDLVLPDDRYLGARSDGGVLIREPDYMDAQTISWERRYAIPVDHDALNKMYAFADAQVGKDYDFSNIAGFALHQNWNNSDRWMCSELVLAIAEAGGLWLLNVQPGFTHRIDPGRLHLSPMLIGRRYYPVEGTQ